MRPVVPKVCSTSFGCVADYQRERLGRGNTGIDTLALYCGVFDRRKVIQVRRTILQQTYDLQLRKKCGNGQHWRREKRSQRLPHFLI
jgi:hypothetical protein